MSLIQLFLAKSCISVLGGFFPGSRAEGPQNPKFPEVFLARQSLIRAGTSWILGW
jgi:hypothetical protein